MIGDTLGKYRIVELLGQGGMAEVYKAHQLGLDRFVAIKIMHRFLVQQEDFLTRFQREARAVATLRHPNIVQMFDFDHDPEQNAYYMVMEYVPGPSLKLRLQELVQRGQHMPVDEAVSIVAALADALDYAHQRGMVHRDVKPANVLFGEDDQPILTDFGIAKMIDAAGLTISGAMIGTPAYMAPEQGMGEVGDERSDVYSLGVVLYQILTGMLPFEADTPMGVVLKHINEPLPSPRSLRPDVPEAVEQVLLRAMAKAPAQRYQSAAEFAADLRRAIAGLEVVPWSAAWAGNDGWAANAQRTPPPGFSPLPVAAAPVARRPRWLWPVFGVVVLLLLGLGGWGAWMMAQFLRTIATPPPQVVAQTDPDLAATEIVRTMEAIQATLSAPTQTPTVTPTPSATFVATLTPDSTATALAACQFSIRVVESRPVVPSVLMPGQQFTKRWRITHTGSCPWPDGVTLVRLSGDGEVVATPRIASLAPGETVEIVLTLRAPTGYASYGGVWQLQDAAGRPMGQGLDLTWIVGPTPTPLPTPTPTPTPTPLVSPTPIRPLEMSHPALISCSIDAPSGGWSGVIWWSARGGPGPQYRYFYGSVVSEQELPSSRDEFSSFIGNSHLMTYYTTSGSGVFWPLPVGCCLGYEGRYVGSDGSYEVVWASVQYDEGDCP